MNIKVASLAFVAVVVTSGCASTTDIYAQETVKATEVVQATDALEVADQTAYDPDAVTCKRITKTGSRFRTKVCATNAEWKASEERAAEITEEMQDRPQYGKAY